MSSFIQRNTFILKEITKGRSVTRAYLNRRLADEKISGVILDVGGGHSNDYLRFLNLDKNVTFITFDVKSGQTIDFETDKLPHENSSVDTTLFLNVMEHIYNYKNISSEVMRITKPCGKIVGFVPFLMWYHPDHRDFFRYSHEALYNIFSAYNPTKINIEFIGGGPFVAAAHMILLSFPKIVRPPIFLVFLFADKLFLWLRPSRSKVFALGYYFIITK